MKYNIIADYHTHTNMAKGSIPILKNILRTHAKGSIRENCLVAMNKGLTEIAITDHGYKQITYGIDKHLYKDIREEINEINSEYKSQGINFRVLLGAEANLLNRSGDVDIDDEFIEYLDIICVGYHRAALQSLDLRKNYTEAAINAMLKYNVSILNHPVDKVHGDIIEIGKVAIKRGTALEINRKHKNIHVDEIRKLKELGAMFSLGSDAHKPADVGEFGPAYTAAIEAGLTNDDIINAEGKAHRNIISKFTLNFK